MQIFDTGTCAVDLVATMLFLKRTKCVLALLGLAGFLSYAGATDPCKTPDNGDGVCVSAQACPILETLINNKSDREKIIFLNKLTCGYEGVVPKLCCPKNKTADSPTPAPTPTPTPVAGTVPSNGGQEEPVDVSTSPRLSMLPLSICGQNTAGRIFGGKKANVYDYPSMAVLGYQTGTSPKIGFHCGGSIINDRYVLTAAHCVTELRSTDKLVKVRLGELHLGNETDCSEVRGNKICAPPVEDYGIEEVIFHSNFSIQRFRNDIALIRLNQSVNFTGKGHIQPICLPIGIEQRKDLGTGGLIVTGWGIYEEYVQSEHLLYVSLPLVPHKTCAETYAKTSNIVISPTQQACAGGKGSADSCSGDSGGPLQGFGEIEGDQRNVQFGIVSFGPRDCAKQKLPGVYTRVGFYMDWILNNMRP